jgi:hypothetical protein
VEVLDSDDPLEVLELELTDELELLTELVDSELVLRAIVELLELDWLDVLELDWLELDSVELLELLVSNPTVLELDCVDSVLLLTLDDTDDPLD